MKISKETKNKAAKLFETYTDANLLYVNSKGHFFTNKNLAELSERKKKNIAEIKRSEVDFEETKQTGSKDTVKTIDELKTMGDALPKYLNKLKQAQLFEIKDTLKLETKAVISNKELAALILDELTKQE